MIVSSLWKFGVVTVFLVYCCSWSYAGLGFSDESDAGIVITTGNSPVQNFVLKQLNTYGWNLNLLKLQGKYLYESSDGNTTERHWILNLRYERELSERLSLLTAQGVEGNVFAGYAQRYDTDFGTKYWILKKKEFTWDGEAGYRYTIEDRLLDQVKQNMLRFYTKAEWTLTKTSSINADVEYLPNLSVPADYRLNAELGLRVAMNEVLSIKTGYSVNYRNQPPQPARKHTDTELTTVLAAKF